jgi:AcrR family transcriptional regulator
MARRPRSRSARRPAARGAARPAANDRDRIIDAFMGLLAEAPIERIGMADVGAKAGVSLADLRAEFASTFAILAAHVKALDRAVLSGGGADMADESPRERLFDVLMRRIELLAPHRQSVRSLMRSARCNPGLALALNALTVNSQQWMLAAAGIDASGPKGMLRAQGLALLFANVLRIWVDDEDEGLAGTLAALDRELARGQRLAGMLDDVCSLPERVRQFTRGQPRPRRRGREAREAA